MEYEGLIPTCPTSQRRSGSDGAAAGGVSGRQFMILGIESILVIHSPMQCFGP